MSDKILHRVTSLIIAFLIISVASICYMSTGSLPISGNSVYSPYYNGNEEGDKVALMFNVYQNTEVVNGILDVLKSYNVKCTFFIGGCWADDNEETVKRIASEGHEIGNHGYYHKNHATISPEENKREIELTEALITSMVGKQSMLFAPPSGAIDIEMLKIVYNLGYKTILWSKDTIDWRDKSSKIVYNRACKNITSGDLVLMHPEWHTLEALGDILINYKEKALSAVTVSECIA